MQPFARMTCSLGALVTATVLAASVPATAQAPCTCRAAGASFALEACTCLNTPSGPRLACCGKVLNNTAWRFTDERCPTAQSPLGETPAAMRQAMGPPALLPQSTWNSAEALR